MNAIKSIGKDINKIHPWIISYFINKAKSAFLLKNRGKKHIFLCVCDHFEPLWGDTNQEKGFERVKKWCEQYPRIAEKYRDENGCVPKYTLFYPIEEYHHQNMNLLAELCHKGYAEIEVHLHHDNDNSDNLRQTLVNFKDLLANKYGLLAKDKETGEVKYAFIHGNWALNNSRRDGRWCGVNNEITILQETGCYADFTMPSAPDETQTNKINSIYYAVDNPNKPRSHNLGTDTEKGKKNQKGLLMVQGPLLLNWKDRKGGIFPKIENSALTFDQPVTLGRIKLWLNANVTVKNQENYLFIKLHTHGCQERNYQYLLKDGLDNLFSYFRDNYNNNNDYVTHFVSAREFVNVIKALEDDFIGPASEMKDYYYKSFNKTE